MSETAVTDERRVRLTVPAAPTSVRLARRMTQAVLETWSCPVDADTALLLVSELVTNALLHGCAPHSPVTLFEIDITASHDGLHVEVLDPDTADHRELAVRHAADSSESGRGLELIEALSTSWGCKTVPSGKYVYFDITTAGPEPGRASAERQIAASRSDQTADANSAKDSLAAWELR